MAGWPDVGLVALAPSARLPLPGGLSVAEGREVNDGIHPESLRRADEDIAGTAAVVEPTGSETRVMLRAGGSVIMAGASDAPHGRTRCSRGSITG